MMKNLIIITSILVLLTSCGSGSSQGEQQTDTATKLQEGPQGSHTPDNEPENRDRIDSTGQSQEGSDNQQTDRQ